MMKLVVVGCGAQGRYVIEACKHLPDTQVVALLDAIHEHPANRFVDGIPVAGGLDRLALFSPDPGLGVVVAVADLDRKQRIITGLRERGYLFHSVIHPRACLATTARLGVGCIINAGVIIETGGQVGDHVIIHSGAIIEHDVVIEDLANIGPGVSMAGRARVGQGARIYTGATLLPDIAIGPGAIVGAGAVVTRNVAAGIVVAGVPARPLRQVVETVAGR